MVVQVAPDAGQVGDDVDAEPPELLGRTDAREQQQLRRLDRAAADDHLALGADLRDGAVADDLDADAPPTLEQQPLRAGSRQHGEVGRTRDRRQEGGRGALADAVLDVELAERDAVETLAVVVVVEGDARLLRRGDDRGVERMRLVAREHVQRPARAVVGGRAPVEVLRALEQRQHVVVAPAVVAEVRPGVVVAAMPARVDHPVQRARSAQHLAARPVQLAPGARGLRHRPVAPVLLAVPELEQPRRIVDRRVVVRRRRPRAMTTSAPASTSRRATTAPPDPEPTTMTSATDGMPLSFPAISGALSQPTRCPVGASLRCSRANLGPYSVSCARTSGATSLP